MSTPRVLIIVEGGVVQEVLSDQPVQVLVKDWDEIADGRAHEYLARDYRQPDYIVSSEALEKNRLSGVDAYLTMQED